MDRQRQLITLGFVAAAFVFRLFYGLSMPFWFEDERQVFLIGLRSFARGEWPYFGADVVWTGGQVPGALLGWLVRGPLTLWPVPEAPIVALNVLSAATLALFAWYLTRRLTLVPPWLIWTTLFVLPWTLNFSTHVVNPSYALAGGIVFFVGFFEGMPALSRAILPVPLAWGMMGAGLAWMMQIHMSWVLLPPYVVTAFAAGLMRGGAGSRAQRIGWTARAAGGFALGAAVVGSLLIPTVVRYGFGAGDVGSTVQAQVRSPLDLVTTAARVLSFASFEVNRFLGLSSAERALVFWRHPLLLPFAAIVAAAGLAQPIWMTVSALRTRPGGSDWARVRLLLVATVLLIYATYFFSIRGPQAHSFLVVFPVAILFATSCWQVRAEARGGRMPGLERVAMVTIASSVILHAGLAADRWTRLSLYADRELVAAAIRTPNDRFLGDRRDTNLTRVDRSPRPIDRVGDAAAFAAADPLVDLRIVEFEWTPVLGRFSSFRVTVGHVGNAAAWVDIRLATAYFGATGERLAARERVIKHVIQPGETRTWRDVPDGAVPAGARTMTVTVAGAERVVAR